MTDVNVIKSSIISTLPDAEVMVSGDGRHFQACVISDAFCGKTLVQQHQMIYKSLGESVGNAIHALSIQTYTTAQWEDHKKLQL